MVGHAWVTRVVCLQGLYKPAQLERNDAQHPGVHVHPE